MKLIGHSLLYFIGRILPACIAVLGVSLYTRLLDPRAVGAYAVLSSIALFSAVAFNWLRVAVFRTLGSALHLEPDFMRTVIVLFGRTSLVVAVAETVALFLYDHHLSPVACALTVAAAISSAWFELNLTLLQSRGNVRAYGTVNLSRAVATVACSLGFIALGVRTEALLAGYVLGNCTSLLVSRPWFSAFRATTDKTLFRTFMVFGWPATITGALSQMSVTFDRLLLNVAAGTAAVGIYAVAYDFSRQTVFLLISATALAGQPMAIRLLDLDGEAAAQVQLRQNARLMFAVALPAVVALTLLAKPIADVVLGARFRADAGFVIGMIALATALSGLRTFYFDQAFELARRTRPQAWISGATAAVGIIGSLTLIPRFGALGAASSALLASTFGISLSIALGRRIFKMPIPLFECMLIAVATALMAAALVLLPRGDGIAGLAAHGTIAAAVYFLVLATATYRTELTRLCLAWRRRSANAG
jgi:O-antigen/teichoic acid export membrane protein